jgi:hypothetical protein
VTGKFGASAAFTDDCDVAQLREARRQCSEIESEALERRWPKACDEQVGFGEPRIRTGSRRGVPQVEPLHVDTAMERIVPRWRNRRQRVTRQRLDFAHRCAKLLQSVRRDRARNMQCEQQHFHTCERPAVVGV